jgi:hypothetical protein
MNAQDKLKINHIMMEQISKYLAPHPEACRFITAYRDYVHAIDDLIDATLRPDSEQILKTFAQASTLFTLPFWNQYGTLLIVTEKLVNNTYADSVLWENSPLDWQRRDASVLRHAGVDMFFAVVALILGGDKLREISADFRTQCHLIHMNEEGQPV